MTFESEPGPSDISLRLTEVTYGYDPAAPVLQGVSLALEAGLVLLLGPNGHGKSTLLKLLAGVERPDRGTVEVGPFDLWREEAESRRLLAYVPEHPDITPYASVREVLELAAALREGTVRRVSEVLESVGLDEDLASRSIRRLSKGQRRRAMLAAALLGHPPVLLMDEPLDALDRNLRDDLVAKLKQRVAEGGLVVVVTHEIEPFVEWATSAVAMSRGRAHKVSRLPEGSALRLELFEAMARGEVDGLR